jgi:hypothetical protein
MVIRDYLLSLGLTIAVELIVFVAFGFRHPRAIGTAVLINLISHPLLFYGLYINSIFIAFHVTELTIAIIEALVILVEWILLCFVLGIGRTRLLATSLSMNLASFISGLIVFPPYSPPW